MKFKNRFRSHFIISIFIFILTGCNSKIFENIDKNSFSVGEFTYVKSENTITVMEYFGGKADITIPSNIDNIPVAAIDDIFFSNLVFVKSISMESETLPSLTEKALNHCSALNIFYNPQKNTYTINLNFL